MPLVGIETLPTPFSPASVPLPPETGGRGHTSLRVGGWGESQFRRGAYTVVLFICTYFVCTAVLIGWEPAGPPSILRTWAHIRGRYWSTKIDDISLWTSACATHLIDREFTWKSFSCLNLKDYKLKGNLTRDFRLLVFSCINVLRAPEYCILWGHFKFFENLQRFLHRR